MIITRHISFKKVIVWSLGHMLWLLAYMAIVGLLYKKGWLDFTIPWTTISVIGTAVAFYVGFKNNQSYDRMWEARKIWGGIVNDSRTWSMMVMGYVTNEFRQHKEADSVLFEIRKRLIYRHIAWLYAHRSQLLVAQPWEHIGQKGHVGKSAHRFQRLFGIGLLDDQVTKDNLEDYLPKDEYARLVAYANTATQIINEQSLDLTELRHQDFIEDFRHMEMENILRSFYALQGKNERIKKFPLPRQYSTMSRYFVGIFIFLLPFSIIPSAMHGGQMNLLLAVILCALVGWIFVMMEVIGDYSEYPFQGMANDIPMLSLCRTIEIDMREMLGDKDIPKPIQSVNDVLM